MTLLHWFYLVVYTIKAVECRYKECEYHDWTAWSATCGITARRSRTLRKAEDKRQERFGGCAGLPKQCENKETESQQLKSCSCKFMNNFLVVKCRFSCNENMWRRTFLLVFFNPLSAKCWACTTWKHVPGSAYCIGIITFNLKTK